MATLMGLFQTTANIRRTLDSLGDVSAMITAVADRIDKATPSVKGLNTAFDALDLSLEATAKARQKIKDLEPTTNQLAGILRLGGQEALDQAHDRLKQEREKLAQEVQNSQIAAGYYNL